MNRHFRFISDKSALSMFQYFRKAWSPKASYHLTRVRLGVEWQYRLFSAAWLMSHNIPYNGSAPSMGFKGL